MSDEVLDRLVRLGIVHRVARGVFVEANLMPNGAVPRHALDVAAAQASVQRPTFASGASAALLHGARLLQQPDRAQLTSETGRVLHRPGYDVTVAELPDGHIHRNPILGVPIVSAARAVIDVARTDGVRAGVVAADSLLHRGRVSRRQLETVLRACHSWPRGIDASRVVTLSDKRSESVLESVSRVVMWEHRLVLPESQVWIELTSHPPVRVDFYWKQYRLVGEADGKVKYDASIDPDALYKERIRQEWLEDDEFTIVRWRWAHVEGAGRALIERLHVAMGRAQRRLVHPDPDLGRAAS